MNFPSLQILWGNAGRETREWTPGVVTWADIVMEWTDPANLARAKDTTGYVFGTFIETRVNHNRSGPAELCTGYHRKRSAVVDRSAIVLDADYPEADFLDKVQDSFPYAALIHSTWSHTELNPRYRLIIPLDRPVERDDYERVAQVLMEDFGVSQFDASAAIPNQFSYLPAAEDPDQFEALVLPGQPLPLDSLADRVPTYEGRPRPHINRKKRDPFELPGIVGAFNRVYDDWDELIETFDLPYTAEGEGRYRFNGTHGAAGAGPIADMPGLWYSHHANDPAAHVACSAFDLVRIHQHGHLDEDAAPDTPVNRLPSYGAASTAAQADGEVEAEAERHSSAQISEDLRDAFGGDNAWDGEDGDGEDSTGGDPLDTQWLGRLQRNARDSSIRDTMHNWDLLVAHDPVLRSLWFNDLTANVHADVFPPGRSAPDGVLNTAARDSVRSYLERTYAGFKPSAARVDQVINDTSMARRRNLVRTWIEELPEWDGTPRVETSMPGVEPTPHSRMVLRKALVGAIARIMDPGCKWDHVLVLTGKEGLYKTTWVEKMANGWSDTLGAIDNKDTLLRMRSKWIMVAEEGHSLRKADNDAIKEFITRREDSYRTPYDRAPATYKRHNVIWMTTNDQTFLRRAEGNRRFLVLNVTRRFPAKVLTDEYIEQVWAEALYLYNNGEALFLSDEEAQMASSEREAYTEEDAQLGDISEYLETRVDGDWGEMFPEQRMRWLADVREGFRAEGDHAITEVCTRQIWAEAFGQTRPPQRKDLLEITTVMQRMPGWTRAPGRKRIKGYGQQVIYVRTEPAENRVSGAAADFADPYVEPSPFDPETERELRDLLGDELVDERIAQLRDLL